MRRGSVTGAIRDVFRRRERADLLIDARTGERWTYAAAMEGALAVAAALRAAGLRRGDRVNVIMENSPGVVLAYLGAAAIGVGVVPLNRSSAPEEIAYALATMGGRLTLVSPRTRELAAGPAITISADGGRILVGGAAPPATGLVPFEGVSDTDVFSVTLTSGSTARPRGVIHTIGTIFGNARAFNAHVAADERTVFLHGLPMSYMAGILNSIACPLMAGGTIVVGEEFGARTFLMPWAVPRRFGVNTMWATPTAIALILELDRGTDGVAHCAETRMRIFVGTAPLATDLRLRFEERYGVPLRTSYGLSELLLLTVRRPELGEAADTNGSALPEIGIRIAGEAGGEVLVRTPYASPGYVGAHAAAPEWFATGDLGHTLDRGELVITGRKKDLIITGGVNVSPAAVELAIRAHPAVRDAVAVGVPDAILGEAVAVAVELEPDADGAAVERELLGAYSAGLGVAQRPRHVVVAPELPRSPTGKIRRAEVRALVSGRVAAAR